MKRLLIATALTMCAAGAYASNFRGADQVYIPTAGRIIQAQNNTFISDVQLANLTADTVVVSVIYQPINTKTNPADATTIGTEFKDVITLAPYERKEYKDFFLSALNQQSGFGMLILNGCLQGANCGPSGQDDQGNAANYRAISAESRIYSFKTLQGAASGTKGQLFSGIPWYNFVSMLQAQAGSTRLHHRHLAHRQLGHRLPLEHRPGQRLAVLHHQHRRHPLPWPHPHGRQDRREDHHSHPAENIQTNFSSLFPEAAFGENYFVVVQQRTSTPNPSGVPSTCDQGCPAFMAYGSVLDNVTDDATTLESQYLKELSGDAIFVIYPTGAGKNPWRRSVRK